MTNPCDGCLTYAHYPCMIENQNEHVQMNGRILSLRSQALIPRHNVLMPRPDGARGVVTKLAANCQVATAVAQQLHTDNSARQAFLAASESLLTVHRPHSNCPTRR